MPAAVAAKAPVEFNPKKYQKEFAQFAKDDPRNAGMVAAELQSVRKNLEEEINAVGDALGQVVEIGAGSVGALLVGWLDGGWEAKRQAMIDAWESTGAAAAGVTLEDHPTPFTHDESKQKDPTKIFGFLDKSLAITLGFTTGAILVGVMHPDGTRSLGGMILKSIAYSQFSYFLGSTARNGAYKREETRIEKEGLEPAD